MLKPVVMTLFVVGIGVEFFHFLVPVLSAILIVTLAYTGDQYEIFAKMILSNKLYKITDTAELFEAEQEVSHENIMPDVIWMLWLLLSYVFRHETNQLFVSSYWKNWIAVSYALMLFFCTRLAFVPTWFAELIGTHGSSTDSPKSSDAMESGTDSTKVSRKKERLGKLEEVTAFVTRRNVLIVLLMVSMFLTFWPSDSSVITREWWEVPEFFVKTLLFFLLYQCNYVVWKYIYRIPTLASLNALTASLWMLAASPLAMSFCIPQFVVFVVEAKYFSKKKM